MGFERESCLFITKKWSGINFEEKGSYIIGAPEFILKEKYSNYKEQIEEYSNDYRVI